MSGFGYFVVAIVLAVLAGVTAFGLIERRELREKAADEAADEARKAAARAEAEQREVRLAHLDAAWATCFASRTYVWSLLAPHEAEVTGLAPLVLQLTDDEPAED